jgi:hypothetical protein
MNPYSASVARTIDSAIPLHPCPYASLCMRELMQTEKYKKGYDLSHGSLTRESIKYIIKKSSLIKI